MAKAGKLVLKFSPEQLEQARKEVETVAYAEGFSAGAQKALDYLENRYLHDENRPDRNTPEAKAILTVSRELAEFMRKAIQVNNTVSEESKH